MNAQPYYLGIDGGGTKTTAMVADATGKLIAREVGEDTNFYLGGVEDSRGKLKTLMDRLSAHMDIGRIRRAFIGSSAVNDHVGEDVLRRYVNGIIRCPTTMKSDAYAALAGHTLGGAGSLIISGTGSMGIAMNPAGKMLVCGGWGHLPGDDGSAYDIALSAIRLALRAYDGLEESTPLWDRLYQRYQPAQPYDLIEKLTFSTSRTEIASFAEIVYACALENDWAAKAILLDAGKKLARIACRIADFAQSSCVAVYGSVLMKDGFVREAFEKEYISKTKGGVVSTPRLPAEAGAVVMAMREDGVEISDTLIEQLERGLKGELV